MAERTVCPHCSFRNFSVSRSCARCEKPLRATSPQAPPSAPVRPPPLPAAAARARGLPAASLPTAPAPPAARPPSTPPPKRAAASSDDVATRIGPFAPAPRPQAPRPAPGFASALPGRSVHDDSTRLGATLPPPLPPTPHRPRPPSKAAPNAPGEAAARSSAPLQPASLAQQGLAIAVDAAVPLLAALAWAMVELVVRRGRWPDANGDALTGLAVWLHAYPGTAQRALLVAAGCAIGHTVHGLRSGRSLGRRASHTLLVGVAGPEPTKGASWSAALWHLIGGAASVFALGAGHFWPIVDPRRRTWANVLSRTLVVRDAPRKAKA